MNDAGRIAEVARLEALRRYAILDTPGDADFDQLTQVAAAVCGTSMALITLVDEHRQWFKARVGVELSETPRDISLCAIAIQRPEVMVVEDAREDARLRDNPLVTGETGIRFYAGAPLITPDGHALGTLCVLDRKPRQLSEAARTHLAYLARLAVLLLEARRTEGELASLASTLRYQQGLLASAGEASTDGILVVSDDRRWLVWNQRFLALWEIPPELAADAGNPAAVEHVVSRVADRRRFLDPIEYYYAHPDATGSDELHLADGRIFERHTAPVRDAQQYHLGRVWFYRDVTAKRRAEESLRLQDERLRLAVLSAQVYAWEWEMGTRRLTWVSDPEPLFGPGTRNWTARQLQGLMDEGDAAQLRSALRLTVESGAALDVACRFTRSDGAVRCMRVRGGALRDRTGRAIRVQGACHDDTARKRLEGELQASEAQIQTVADNLPAYIAYFDATGACRFANKRFAALHGLSGADAVGKQVGALAGTAAAAAREAVLRGEATSLEEQVDGPGGRPLVIESHWIPDRSAGGEVKGYFVLGTDISHHKLAEETLRADTAEFTLITDSVPAGIAWFDAQFNCRFANKRYAALLGQRPADLVGRNLREILGAERLAGDAAELARAADGERVTMLRVERLTDGGARRFELSLLPQCDADGTVRGFYALASDLSARAQVEAEIRHQALHDALTDLPNRVLLKDLAQRAIAGAQRHGGHVAMLFIDLDAFKEVNDSLGHRVGDALLKDVATRLRASLRDEDVVARQGGDEFIVLLQNLPSPQAAEPVAQKIVEALSQPFCPLGHEAILGASVGVSVFPMDGSDPETLLQNADTAMYHAKDSGKNKHRYFTAQMNQVVQSRMLMEGQLRGALERGELRLDYQPIVELASGRVVSAEALLRWVHPQRGLVAPAEFIPVAEAAGLLVPIGEWVILEACRCAREWRELGFADLSVAVNISARQLYRGDLVGAVHRTLARPGMDASLLGLEITEAVVHQQPEAAAATLRDLAQSGVELTIDDFGTGASSLSALQRFHFHKLKIDRSFVGDVTSDPHDAAVVSAIVGLARSLRLTAVAEGLETGEQLEFLTREGCPQAQGHFLGRPVEAAAFPGLAKPSAGLPSAGPVLW